jgi:DNA-binding transcriptional LysR family regulator
MAQSPITIEALTVIDAIDKRGSYAAAAEQLNKVPSALSYIVQKLEEQLNVTLFQKQGRRAVLTPAGKHLLKEGREILIAVAQLTDKTKTIATGWEAKINIAIDSVLDSKPIFDVLTQFLAEHPFIEIDVCEEVMNGAWEALVEDRVDLLIGAPLPVPQQKGIQTAKFITYEPVFCCSPNHPLVKLPQPIAHKEIAKHRTVVVHDSSQTSIPWTAGVIAESQYFYVPTLEFKIKAQLAGIGCGFLPRNRIQHLLQSNALVELAIEGDHKPRELLLAHKLVNRGKGLQKLRKLLQQAFAEQSINADQL